MTMLPWFGARCLHYYATILMDALWKVSEEAKALSDVPSKSQQHPVVLSLPTSGPFFSTICIMFFIEFQHS